MFSIPPSAVRPGIPGAKPLFPAAQVRFSALLLEGGGGGGVNSIVDKIEWVLVNN